MAAPAFVAEEVAEFVDTPLPGNSLFVQSTWSAGLPEKLPEGADAVLCRLLACDGSRCWEGTLRRSDLSGPLGESWGKQSNLRLLLDALAARGQPASFTAVGSHGGASISSAAFEVGAAFGSRDTTLPLSEATWSCPDGAGTFLNLSIRFIYREGPVVAVRGVSLPRASLSDGLSRFFALAHGAQTAASACIAAAEGECAQLQVQQETLLHQLESSSKEIEEYDKKLLAQMTQTLNKQKKRCLNLWVAGCQAAAADGPEPEFDPTTASLVEEPMTISLEASLKECLDREELPTDNAASLAIDEKECDLTGGSAPSLVFASESLQAPLSAEVAGEGSAFTFTIPLTLGMGDYGSISLKGPSKRSATVESLLAPGAVRRKTAATL